MRHLRHKRNVILLAKKVMDAKKFNALEKKLLLQAWFLVGYEKYFFPAALLNKVLAMHEKIDSVPKGYYYADLHQRRIPPLEMMTFDQRKQNFITHYRQI
uniref:Uncharacterized protein n=1 Tax=Favella ehrenbergii TaxID=182087 RepID=A0A7S3I7R0_9SPIT|mmetsp:Transcript_4245/g.5284  ORF Transcript_4245/g.5284 Transcript_4245/m.5284 type:complete len:100 (+) Transcript_4245:1012-1311(+)